MPSITIGNLTVGDDADRLTVIAGPCVAESLDLCLEIARTAREQAERAGLHYLFKASFDKANRTSILGQRGPGLEHGLEMLAIVRAQTGVPVLTDIHEPWQAEAVAEVVDVIQIPAFLCRQTDLLVAAARTGRCVNVKKAQFMAPWDMAHVVDKLTSSGCSQILLTERGVCHGYNTLVVDLRALPVMRGLGFPVCMDATHAVQQPSAADGQSGGRREFVVPLARAAAAVGIDALFLEVHPAPEAALSDSATMLPLAYLEPLLTQIRAIDDIVKGRAPEFGCA